MIGVIMSSAKSGNGCFCSIYAEILFKDRMKCDLKKIWAKYNVSGSNDYFLLQIIDEYFSAYMVRLLADRFVFELFFLFVFLTGIIQCCYCLQVDFFSLLKFLIIGMSWENVCEILDLIKILKWYNWECKYNTSISRERWLPVRK